MWLSTDDARSDFVLAVAAAVLGRYAAELVLTIPGRPLEPIAEIVIILFQVVMTGLAPFLLARYRNDTSGAFGLKEADRSSLVTGVVVAAPLLVAHLLPLTFQGDFGALARGLLGRFAVGSPAIGIAVPLGDVVVRIISLVIIAVGSWMFISFISVRARDAFRSPDMDVTEALRTFGMGAVGASLVLGLLRSIAGFNALDALLLSATLLVVLLLTDQYVPARLTATRATLLAPMITVAALYVLPGGLFRGNLLFGLHTGAAAAVIAICATALIEARKGWATIPLVVASAIYPVAGIAMQPVSCGLLLC